MTVAIAAQKVTIVARAKFCKHPGPTVVFDGPLVAVTVQWWCYRCKLYHEASG